MMKVLCALLAVVPLAWGFVPSTPRSATRLALDASVTSRDDFLKSAALVTIGTLGFQAPALATGRATLEVTYAKYSPRIRTGGQFYGNEFKQIVVKGDWAGIKEALGDVPPRKKEDLQRADAGVAARARQAGEFSEDRVLVAADLYASGFSSQNSFSPKTKKMKGAVEKLRGVTKDMLAVARQGLGEDSGGGFFGFGGAKKPSEAELKKKIRDLYVEGGNAWNEYVVAANDELALKFDRFEYIK